MSIYNSAIAFAARGWPVLPLHSIDQADGRCTCGNPNCDSQGKHPLTLNGVKDATTDANIIKRWCDETNDMANIGIAAGNGLLIVDIDAKSGGPATLDQMQKQHGALPPTPTVGTGGGGRHFYFALPNGVTISNKVAVAQGIDIRSDGGYVVAPPSIHKSGEHYSWLTPQDTPLATIPPWLLAIADGGAAMIAPPSGSLKVGGGDFATASGVSEGERNATLCRLAGVHFARGETVDAIQPLALDWADRCTPAYPHDEVLKTLNALSKKHEAGVSIISGLSPAADDVDAIPIASPQPWPVLGADAYYGLAGEFVRLVEPETESDVAAILTSLLVCVGSVVGRSVWFQVEGDKHFLNLFATLVGQSSRGRKGTSLGRTLCLWGELDPWRKDRISSGLSSGEGLKYHVRDPLEVLEPIKEKGKVVGYQNVVKDPGVSDKRLLVVEPEYAQALKVMQREGNTLSPVLRQAWDTGNLKTLTKNDPTVATDAHISVLGHITSEELKKLLSACDTANGFANRFLWILVRRSKLLPDGGRQIDLTALQSRLQKAVANITGCMVRSPEAQRLWHELYPMLTAERPGRFGMATGRAEAQTLRLSMVYAILDASATIQVDHLRAAHAVWKYAEASARFIFEEEEQLSPLEKKLLQVIAASPGINRKTMHKALGGHVNAEAMVKALGRLAKDGLARSELVSTGGRPCESWSLAQPKANAVALAAAPAAAQTDVPGQSNVGTSDPAGPNERTKGNPNEENERLGSDSSLVRGPQAEAMPLADLLVMVQQSGGKIVRSATGTFGIEGVDYKLLTPEVTAALVMYQADLAMLIPTAKPMTEKERRHAEWLVRYEAAQVERRKREAERMGFGSPVISDEEFYQSIRDIGKKPSSSADVPSPSIMDTSGTIDEFFDRLRAGIY
jgi:hypothetical protein